MWIRNRTPVFGVVLHPYEPGMIRQLNDLNQIGRGIDPGSH